MTKNNNEDVIVFLSTYNGEKYLEEQLESLKSQKDVNVKVRVRDDGSTDNTINILERYTKKMDLKYFSGKNLGPAKSFMDLIENTESTTEYYALCDQDDIWLEDKLISAINKMKEIKEDTYKLYYCNATSVDKDLNKLFEINNYKYNNNIYTACYNNPAIGCTIVFNKKIKDILIPLQYDIRMHDWWLYKICIFLGGKIIKENRSYILYRQHGDNAIGAQKRYSKIEDLKNKVKKIPVYAKEDKILLDLYEDKITEKNKKMINNAINIVNLNFFQKSFFILDKRFNLGNLKQTIKFKLSILMVK